MQLDAQSLNNIKKVSLIFFLVTGFMHLGSTMMVANGIALKASFLVQKTMDIPFILTGLIYGFSSIRINITDQNKQHKLLDISLISVIILTLVILIYINLFIETNVI